MIKFLLNTMLTIVAMGLIVVITYGKLDTGYSLLSIIVFIWIFGLVNPKPIKASPKKRSGKWAANSFGKWSGGGRNKNRTWK